MSDQVEETGYIKEKGKKKEQAFIVDKAFAQLGQFGPESNQGE